MNAKRAKYPQLRFKDFTDPWEQYKLSYLTERVTRKNKNNESSRPLTISAQGGLIDQNDFFDKQIASRDVSGYFLVKNGEFAYNKSYSNGYPWGAVKRLDTYDMGVLSTLYIVFRPTNVSSQFLVSYYDTTRWYKEVAKNAAEGARNHGLLNIPPTDFFNTVLVIPRSIEEQDKIGTFFKQLDHLITLHQRKLAKLKELKQGYLQKMFPKKGEVVPELRFPGFTDAWEQRKLGEISKTTIGEFVIKNKQDSDAPYPVYNGGTSYTGFYDEFNNEGDKIVISARGANAGFVNYIGSRFWAGNSCYSIDILDKRKFSVEFMYQFLKRNQHLFTDYQQAANIPSVSKKDVATFIVKFPTPNEQCKIGSFFKQLDHLITLHQRKLKHLQLQKKGLLQQMFC